jgi:MOSC domain-containing protein YiiM
MNTSPMLTIEELKTRYARPGRLEWIGFRSRRRGHVTPMQTAELIRDRGLEGDHSGGRRQVTLIQWEHLAVIADLCGESIIAPERLRRNLAVSGVNLFSLRASRFRLGDALLEGTGHCPPCSRMELELGHGGFNAMRGHGGITARVLRSGTVSVGSPLVHVD